MVRRFNYTNRKKLSRQSVEIILTHEKKLKCFDANINISDRDFPKNAKIYLEAYYKTNYMRFNFGTVSEIQYPKDRFLYDFLDTDIIYFRVKVVDESKKIGRILAMISGLQTNNVEDKYQNRSSILAVNYNAELGQKLYHLEFNEIEVYPILEINKHLENQIELVKSDIFLSTIYPSVVREIANEIINAKESWDEDDDTWQGHWLKYYKIVLKIDSPKLNNNDEDEFKKEWVEEVVSAFCNKYRVRNLFSTIQNN